MLYDPFVPTTQQRLPSMTYDPTDMDVIMPTPIPSKTKTIAIPTGMAPHPATLYTDYTDYGEVFIDEPLDYDTLNDMIKLERVPNRRDSGYETPSSPVEKLQQEEHHIQDAIPAMWAGDHNVSHHVNVSTHHKRPRRSSSLAIPAPPETHLKDSLPQNHEYAASWPSKTIDRCPTCKAALKWRYLTELHTPPVSPTCICRQPATPTKRLRRDAFSEEGSLMSMSGFVEEHLSWPVGS